MEATKAEFLLQLLAQESPEPVDQFEDALCAQLGFERHPRMDYATWRRRRVEIIEENGAEADALVEKVEATLRTRVSEET